MKTVFLLSACVASITLSFGRAPSDTSRKSSQQEEVLTSLAAIKAATAKIEQCLAADEPFESASLSSMNSNASSARIDSAALEASGKIGISQEAMNNLVKSLYTQAIAGIKDVTPLTLEKENMTEIVILGKKIQLILNPSQVIADELAPNFVRI